MTAQNGGDGVKGEELPGIKKKSFSMCFDGGEIWFEHLDGIYEYTDLALEKLEQDYLQFKRPSKPSLISVNLDHTRVNDTLIHSLAEKLLDKSKRFTRAVFVGADKKARAKIRKVISGGGFAFAFIDDFEQAKKWLVSEKYR